MSLDSGDWADLASVFRAGAATARRWRDTGMLLHAEVLESQAGRCSELAEAAARREAAAVRRERKGGLS